MKRRTSFIIPFFILLIVAATACRKSFLEINPKGKLIAQSVSDYDLLLNNNGLLNVGGANAQVFLGDEVAAAEPYFSSAEPRSQRLFKWLPDVYEPGENAPETAALLSQLYNYNKIINEVMDADNGTVEQKNAIRAEAQAGRAWVYFMLIQYFGKPYDAATAATDPGFAIIKEADVTVNKFTRASVQQVYDLITSDLLAAIPHLPVQTTFRIRMSRAAGEGLLGKVYMFMGQHNDALPLLNDALDRIGNAPIPVTLTDYNAAFAPGGEFLPVEIFGPNTPVINENHETIYARQFSNFWITTSELLVSRATMALFGASDQRLNFYSNAPFPFGSPYEHGLMRRMGPLTCSYGVTVPDLVLLRAECRARLNDLPGSVQDLQYLRGKRMPVADAAVPGPVAGNRQQLLAFIFQERIREFASLGDRWFDMRRLSVDPLFGLPEIKHQLYAEDGTITSFTMPKERLVLKIPQRIIAENPGMENNP